MKLNAFNGLENSVTKLKLSVCYITITVSLNVSVTVTFNKHLTNQVLITVKLTSLYSCRTGSNVFIACNL